MVPARGATHCCAKEAAGAKAVASGSRGVGVAVIPGADAPPPPPPPQATSRPIRGNTTAKDLTDMEERVRCAPKADNIAFGRAPK